MIERRRKVVTLYQGNDVAHLSKLREEFDRAVDREAALPKRASTKSVLPRLAKEHDDFQDEMDDRAVEVTVWALTNDQFEQLSEDHPPREGDANDAKYRQNMATFPAAILRASMLSPDDSPADAAKAVEKGGVKLAALGDLSRVQVRNLESEAWVVNVEDDSLPKLSIVSLLRRERGDEQEQQPDTE